MNGLVRNMIKVNQIMLAKTWLAKDTDIYYKTYLEYPVDHEKMGWGGGAGRYSDIKHPIQTFIEYV